MNALRHRSIRFAVGLAGLWMLLPGCADSTQTIVENGVITASNSLLTAILQGFIQAASTANSATG